MRCHWQYLNTVGSRVHYRCSSFLHSIWRVLHSIAPIRVYPWSSISWSERCRFTGYTFPGWIRASSAISLRFSAISDFEEGVAILETRFVAGSWCHFHLAISTKVPNSCSWRAIIRNHLTTHFLCSRHPHQLRNDASEPNWNSSILESTCSIWPAYIYCFGATCQRHGPHPNQWACSCDWRPHDSSTGVQQWDC